MRPTISIVIPTYNGAKYIQSCIESVLFQTRAADEIIISDDNSTDETLQLCEKYGDNIKVFRNDNGPSGFVNGWNHAISLAKSEYISILHQDDLLHPNFLEEIEKGINSHPNVKHLFTPCKFIDGDGNEIHRELKHCTGEVKLYSGQEYAEEYVFTPGHIHRCPGVVTHREIFSRCKYREEAGHIADDDFFLRVGQYTEVLGILQPLAYYREHSTSETGKLDALKLASRLLRDYNFQLCQASHNSAISDRILRQFKFWRNRFVRRTIFYGLTSGKLTFVVKGIRGIVSV